MQFFAAKRSLAPVVVSLLVLTGCGGEGGDQGPDDPDPNVVTITGADVVLPVGGTGLLTAEVRTPAGALIPNATIVWNSLNPLVATVTAGVVVGVSKGQTRAVAKSGEAADTVTVTVVDDFTLVVTPTTATRSIGTTATFVAAAKSSTGLDLPLPPITWSSSSQAVATIGAGGIATAVAAGVTTIRAGSGTVLSNPATLTVTDPLAAVCDGLVAKTTLVADVSYSIGITGPDQNEGDIDVEDSGDLKAVMTRIATGPVTALWSGPISDGSAIINQKLTRNGDTSVLSGAGPVIPLGPVGLPVISLILDLATCRYRLVAAATLATTTTDPNGPTTHTDMVVAQLQATGDLTTWRTFSSINAVEAFVPPHSVIWAAFHPNDDYIIPYGFASGLFANGGGETQVGLAEVTYVVRPPASIRGVVGPVAR